MEDLRILKEKIQALNRELEKTQSSKKTLESELKAVTLQLEITTKELKKIELEKKMLELKITKAVGDVIALKGKLDKIKEKLVFKLKVLQKIGKLGYLRFFFDSQRGNFLDILRWILHFSNEDRKLFLNYNETYKKLKEEKNILKDNGKNLKILEENMKKKLKELEGIEKQKSFLISQIERKGKEQEAQLTLLKEKADRLENLLKILNSREPEIIAKEDIHKYKGVLDWPFRGKVKTNFGKYKNPQYSTSVISNGIEVEIKSPSDIFPIFPGKVIYARWFKGYNNLVVIDHGNYVISIYGFLQISYAKEGEWVTTNKAIGRLSSEPYVYYLEVRDKYIPVDPLGWLR